MTLTFHTTNKLLVFIRAGDISVIQINENEENIFLSRGEVEIILNSGKSVRYMLAEDVLKSLIEQYRNFTHATSLPIVKR